jgi:DNA-binding NarL/FixJ family response regulator
MSQVFSASYKLLIGRRLLCGRVRRAYAQMSAKPKPNLFPELTDREREILEMMAHYKSNSEIAHHLQLSEKTVRNYASNIFNKLQVADRTQAVLKAREAGLG